MAETAGPSPPRVLLVMPEQWPRALLRAALREAGYDALGAPSLAAAFQYDPHGGDRGPVRLIVLDQDALLADKDHPLLDRLLRRHHNPATLLLTRAMTAHPTTPPAALPWHRVIQRPASVGELVTAVQDLLPLPGPARPID